MVKRNNTGDNSSTPGRVPPRDGHGSRYGHSHTPRGDGHGPRRGHSRTPHGDADSRTFSHLLDFPSGKMNYLLRDKVPSTLTLPKPGTIPLS